VNFTVFPFERLPKGSRIVLYGAGDIGTHYYEQLKKTEYCEVLLWLDKTADGDIVKNPKKIIELSENDYDFIVIAMSNTAHAEEVKKNLIGFNIPENKIIHRVHEYLLDISPFSLNEFLYVQGEAEKQLIKYFYLANGNINYFTPLIEEIKFALKSVGADESLKNKSLIEKRTLSLLHDNDFAYEAKIVLLYTIAQAGAITKALLKEFVKLAMKPSNDLSFKYWLILDLLVFWFIYPDAGYDEFFIQMQELKRNYAKELCLNWNPPAYIQEKNLTVCVVISCFAAKTAPPIKSWLKYISPILCSLSDRGYNIHIINISPTFSDSAMGFVKPFSARNIYPETSREDLLMYFNEKMVFHNLKNTTQKERQQDILDLICKINPLCIFDASGEYSSLSYYYSRNYPTVHFPLKRQGYAVSTFFHKHIITQGNDYVEIYPPLTEEKVLRLPLLSEYIAPKRTFDRKEYEIKEDDVVIITVGNRLSFDISNELSEQMCRLIISDNKIKWLIAGCAELPYIRDNHGGLVDRNIIFISYEADLPGLYGICDIYLNPKRIGGGLSVIWAMQQGLVVASPIEAGAAFLGKANSLPTEDDLVPYIESLSRDVALLNAEKEKFRKISKQWDGSGFIEGLIECIKDLSEKAINNKL